MQIKTIPLLIDDLQPTQSTLTPETINHYMSTFPLLRKYTPPEVWLSKDDLIIGDGHNQLWERLVVLNRPFMHCRLLTPDNFFLGPSSYESYLQEFLQKRQISRDNGVYSVSNLKGPIIG